MTDTEQAEHWRRQYQAVADERDRLLRQLEEQLSSDQPFAERVAKMDATELRERILRQATHIESYQHCIDGLGLRGMDGHRDPHDIRSAVDQLQRGMDYQREVIERLQAGMLQITEALCGPSKVALSAGQIVERVEAAKRLLKNEYVEWGYAGGPNQCTHGYAESIPCKACDMLLFLIPQRKEGDEPCHTQDTMIAATAQTASASEVVGNGPVTSKPEVGPETHAGDCSIWAYGGLICDCGFLRSAGRRADVESQAFRAWNVHTLAIAELATLRARVAELEREREEQTQAHIGTNEAHNRIQDHLRQQNEALSAAWQQCQDFLEQLPNRLDEAAAKRCVCGSAQAEYGCPQCTAYTKIYVRAERLAELQPADALAEHDRELRQEVAKEVAKLAEEKNTAVNKWVGRLNEAEKERDSLRQEVERLKSWLMQCELIVDRVTGRLGDVNHSLEDSANAVLSERDHLRTVLAGTATELELAESMLRNYERRMRVISYREIPISAAIQAAQEAIGQQP